VPGSLARHDFQKRARTPTRNKKATEAILGYALVMGTVINLNRYRKQKARKDRAKQAETNRRVHGRTKQEQNVEVLRKDLDRKRIDGHKLDATQGEEPDPDRK
jgi:hypothetical protein